MKACIVLLVLLSFCASAQKKIETAFGKKLGETLIKNRSILYVKDNTAVFQPPKKFRNYQRYELLFTPKSKKIYQNGTALEFEKSSDAEKEVAVVVHLLERTYKTSFTEKTEILGKRYIYENSNRAIIVAIDNEFTNYLVYISYVDMQLYQKAKQEQVELEAKKSDSSML